MVISLFSALQGAPLVKPAAGLASRQGRLAEAKRVLADVYNWLGEGFNSPDLREARQMLVTLNGDGKPRK